MRLLLFFYNLALPPLALLAAPGWTRKMLQRGGFGTGLLQRLALYKEAPELEPSGGLYLHAVSVGEARLALRLIRRWLREDPRETFVLAVTTATGHEVARASLPPRTRLIYAPLDLPPLVRRVLARFQPRQVILVESELWPNLLRIAQKKHIPVFLANARLSPRSERRYRRLLPVARLLTSMLARVCVQEESDLPRWQALGLPPEKTVLTGSLKFDAEGAPPPDPPAGFRDLLATFSLPGQEDPRPPVLAASTHPGEEALAARAIRAAAESSGFPALPLIAPRHAERRHEAKAALEKEGFEVVLRSAPVPPRDPDRALLLIDTTGELAAWIALARAAVIGKSFLAAGGQNPVEALLARVPVVCGPHMENFEPLATRLTDAQAILRAPDEPALAARLRDLLADPALARSLPQKALAVLAPHQGATLRTIQALAPQT